MFQFKRIRVKYGMLSPITTNRPCVLVPWAFSYYCMRVTCGVWAMRLFLALMLALFCAIAPCFAQSFVRLYDNNANPAAGNPVTSTSPLPVLQGSTVSVANITNVTAAIPASSTTVTLTAASGSICIFNLSSTATLYINFTGGTATTSNFGLPPGAGYAYNGSPISAFKVIGSAASGNFSYVAH